MASLNYDPSMDYELMTRLGGCSTRHCIELAEGTIDGIPYCIDCMDDLLQRMAAISMNPSLRETLPALWDR